MRKNASRKTPKNEIVLSDEKASLHEDYFRPNSKWFKTPLHFILGQGGLGDFINWIPAFEWIAEKNPHVIGKLYLVEPFLSVAKYIFDNKETSDFSIHHVDEMRRLVKSTDAVLDARKYNLYMNATGAHLIDLGFMLYCNTSKPFEGYNRLPPINYNDNFILNTFYNVGPYAVFTPGSTVKAREMPAKAFNELVRYTYDLGITPVFLGKKECIEGKRSANYYAKFNTEYDYSLGIDLREKTTLLQATGIMAKAKFVLGVDNGLLHFAGCTEVPIIFGHTVASVEQRDIRRPKGTTINIHVSKKDLPCISCQSNMRFIIGHNFANCVYDDYKCLELLFSNNSETWKKAIHKVL